MKPDADDAKLIYLHVQKDFLEFIHPAQILEQTSSSLETLSHHIVFILDPLPLDTK
jgi:hypothetical protein